MKKYLLITVMGVALPCGVNAATSCSTCPIKYPSGSPVWSSSGVTSASGGAIYVAQARLPYTNKTYADTCEASCYDSDYINVYTCGTGRRVVSTGNGTMYSSTVNGSTISLSTSTGALDCVICPHGSYNAVYGAPDCTLCAGGYQTTGGGASSCSSVKCSGFDYTAGWAVPSWTNTNKTAVSGLCTPTACTAGAYMKTSGSSYVCTACSMGSYSSSAGTPTNCTACPSGTYADAIGTAVCTDCPIVDGVYSDSELTQSVRGVTTALGSDAITDCVLGPGTYYDSTGSFSLQSTQCYYAE